MVFVLYFLGSVVLISGAAWIASLLGAAPSLVTASAGILLAAAATLGATTVARADR
ncbi:MAG TPA: hypothetical protein VHP55_09170 [Usitatibacter sp.]|jgi:predicted tellurium resistance membrane protein TerC|nr:hypothetical protein [Usitatibacter sp.]